MSVASVLLLYSAELQPLSALSKGLPKVVYPAFCLAGKRVNICVAWRRL